MFPTNPYLKDELKLSQRQDQFYSKIIEPYKYVLYIPQSYEFDSFRARKHSAWLPQFNWGMMVFGESGLDTAFYRSRAQLDIPREKFHPGGGRPFAGDEPALRPFDLSQLAAAFVLLGAGLVLTAGAAAAEVMAGKEGHTVVTPFEKGDDATTVESAEEIHDKHDNAEEDGEQTREDIEDSESEQIDE